MRQHRQRQSAPTTSWLGRYRRTAGGVILGLATAAAAFLFLSPAAVEQREEPRPTVAPPTLAPTSTALPRPAGPTTVPAYAPPQLSAEEAMAIVAALPSLRQPGQRLVDVIGGQWTAEYRGDGTWIVRAGEPAWLVLENGRAAMPANIAAINLQGTDAGPKLR